jgi:hypothetical protein
MTINCPRRHCSYEAALHTDQFSSFFSVKNKTSPFVEVTFLKNPAKCRTMMCKDLNGNMQLGEPKT